MKTELIAFSHADWVYNSAVVSVQYHCMLQNFSGELKLLYKSLAADLMDMLVSRELIPIVIGISSTASLSYVQGISV